MRYGRTYFLRPELRRDKDLPFKRMDEAKAKEMTEFYDRIRNKDSRVLERYLSKVIPQSWFDRRFCYARDRQRQARHAATYQLLHQREQQAFNESLKGVNMTPGKSNGNGTKNNLRKVTVPGIEGLVFTTWGNGAVNDDEDNYVN